MTVSEQTRRKAERLLDQGRVHVLNEWTGTIHYPGSGAGAVNRKVGIVAIVDGDSGTYLTTVVDARATPTPPHPVACASCTCEAGRAGEYLCSHETALGILMTRHGR